MINIKWHELSQYFFNKSLKATFSHRDIKAHEVYKCSDFVKISGFKHQLLAIPNQTHSINVIKRSVGGFFFNTDGIFSSNPMLVCSIQVADCLPIYFAHRTEILFGIVHAGWRGLMNGIISKSIKLIKSEKKLIKDIDIYIGPSIQACCFEVSDDIVKIFSNKHKQKKDNGRYSINLQKIAKEKLCSEGVLEKHINISNDCTFCLEDRYFSFRREGEKAGRMFGLIGVR
tara:strand:- start:775 stop:1461 length:687 start_codon:yes stop_codon:yes gene_type:complete